MDIKVIRNQFPTLYNRLIYFDNASTTLTPNCVIKEISRYYTKYSCNLHRGEYYTSMQLDKEIESIRELCASFINAKTKKEIVFTSGATFASNLIANMLLKALKKNDQVVLTHHAHSSLFAPIIKLSKELDLNIIYPKLKSNLEIDLDNFQGILNKNTKIVFLSHLTNLYGIIHPIVQIKRIMMKKSPNALLVLDAAQSVSHIRIDVQKLDCDFLFFSSHKMFGPTGMGILFGKEKWLSRFQPSWWGGGQITNFQKNSNSLIIKDYPYKFEMGTLPLASILGFGATLKFIKQYDIDKIGQRSKELTTYLRTKLVKIKNIIVYGSNDNYNIVFSIKKYAVHDIVSHLDSKGVCVRGGQHCAQLLTTLKNHPHSTIRLSLQFYNTKAEIDEFLHILKTGNLEDFLGGYVK